MKRLRVGYKFSMFQPSLPATNPAVWSMTAWSDCMSLFTSYPSAIEIIDIINSWHGCSTTRSSMDVAMLNKELIQFSMEMVETSLLNQRLQPLQKIQLTVHAFSLFRLLHDSRSINITVTYVCTMRRWWKGEVVVAPPYPCSVVIIRLDYYNRRRYFTVFVHQRSATVLQQQTNLHLPVPSNFLPSRCVADDEFDVIVIIIISEKQTTFVMVKYNNQVRMKVLNNSIGNGGITSTES